MGKIQGMKTRSRFGNPGAALVAQAPQQPALSPPDKSQAKPWAELVLITPAMAEEWLTKNLRNRNLRPNSAATHARTMTDGDWMVTGESVKFDWDGRLIDGQHRLRGIALSGVSVEIFVIRDLHPDVQYVLDTGVRRSAGDALKFAGHTNSVNLAALARTAILWNEGHFKYAIGTPFGRQVTNIEIVEWAASNEDAQEAVLVGDALSRQTPVGTSAAAFAALTLRRIDPEAATAFFTDIVQFRTKGAGDPIATLLKRYQSAAARREDLRTPQHLYLLFRTWNAWRRAESLHVLKMGNVAGGGNPEALSRLAIPAPI